MGKESAAKSKPTPESRYASGVLTGYLVGPQDLGDSKATEGANLFGQAGQGVGILPDWGGLQDTAGQSFYGNLAGSGANPIMTDALGRAFATPDITMPEIKMPDINYGGGGGMGGGFGAGFGGGGQGFGGKIIPNAAVNNALDYLQNTPSVFDQMSGGPIVDEINQRTQAEDQAYTQRALADLEQATEIALANDMAQGLLSGSTILTNRERLAENVLNDINVFRATRSLEQTKYLGDLAMQDIMTQSNNMQSILQQAMVEKGIDANYAAQMAAIATEQATALAQAKIASQTQLGVAGINSQTQLGSQLMDIQARLGMNQQNNAMNLLGLGQQDYNASIDRQIGLGTLPLQLLAGQGGAGTISTGPSSK
jgi:hypothetical protein